MENFGALLATSHVSTDFSVPIYTVDYLLNVTEGGKMDGAIFKCRWDRDFVLHIGAEINSHQDGHKCISLRFGVRPDNTKPYIAKNSLPSEEYARLPYMTTEQIDEFMETLYPRLITNSSKEDIWNSKDFSSPDEEEWQIWMVMKYELWRIELKESITGHIQGVFSKHQPIKYESKVWGPCNSQCLCLKTMSPGLYCFKISFLMTHIQCRPFYDIVKGTICHWMSQQPQVDFNMNLPTSLMIQLQEKYDMCSNIVERFADDDKPFYKELFRSVSLYI